MRFHHKKNQEFWKKKGNIPIWAVALKIGVHEQTLHRWLRVEVDKDRLKIILDGLEQAKKERGVG